MLDLKKRKEKKNIFQRKCCMYFDFPLFLSRARLLPSSSQQVILVILGINFIVSNFSKLFAEGNLTDTQGFSFQTCLL